MCEECGIAYNLRPIAEADLTAADEIPPLGDKEILPVTTLDGEALATAARQARAVYARLYEAYQRAGPTRRSGPAGAPAV